ncbi:MAG: serine protease, partial [Pirellulales bacterium]|nr:serine protease [Pirellulales bacterium]
WVEVGSERLGLPTDPAIVVQRVEVQGEQETLVDVAELSDIPSPVKVSSNGYSYDGPPYHAGSSDVLGKIDIPVDGRYRLQITDLFGGTRSDPGNTYRLVIRQAQPDFALVAWALHMNLRNGDRNALSKPLALRGGTTMPLEVVAIRRDGFDGEIHLKLDNLPDGVTARGLSIPAGKSRGILLITADPGAPRGLTLATFLGSAQIGDQVVTRPCRLASMTWPVPNAWADIPTPRLLADIPVSVGGRETAPLTIAARDKKVWEAVVGQTVKIPLIHFKRSEFSGSTMSLKTFGPGFEKTPPFEIKLTEDHSEAVLDLAKLKTPPGDYVVAFYGSAVAKYRYHVEAIAQAQQQQQQAQEKVAALTQRVKELSEQAGQVAQADKPKREQQARAAAAELKAAQAELAAAAKRVQAATNRAKPKDIVDIIVSEPIAIRVKPGETS